MKKIIPGLIMATVFFAACSSNEKSAEEKAKDKYEQTKESMEQTEKKNPKRFLMVEGHDKRNLLGQTVIKGTITNKATVAKFKDVDVELTFFSKTGVLLEKDHEVVYETIAPGSSTNFKTKYFAPKGTDSVAMKIVGARVE
jgi:ABC-type Fe3+-hydroxamate transport system substrate-binding protein